MKNPRHVEGAPFFNSLVDLEERMVGKMKLDPELEEITHVFTASIEPCQGPTFQHAFHLGTDRKIAEWFCEELFRRHNVDNPLYTVALMRNGQMVDVWDGRNWQHKNPWHPRYVP